MRIAFASDHAAIELKSILAAWAREQGHEVADLGPETDARVDYPDYGYLLATHIAAGNADFGYKLAAAIRDGQAERGVALCGSGIGISIAVNRNPACRCARVTDSLSARLARQHNDANVIAMGARLTGPDMAKECLAEFLSAAFEGGRHAGRVDKLTHPAIEKESA